MSASQSSSPVAPKPSEGQRSVVAVGLLAVGLIHTLDLQSKLHETPYLGVAYVVLILASLVAAIAVLARDDRPWWWLAFGLAAAPLVAYMVSRTVGLPDATHDIGNWLEPLGVASLFVEGSVLMLVGQRLWLGRPSTTRHPPATAPANRTPAARVSRPFGPTSMPSR